MTSPEHQVFPQPLQCASEIPHQVSGPEIASSQQLPQISEEFRAAWQQKAFLRALMTAPCAAEAGDTVTVVDGVMTGWELAFLPGHQALLQASQFARDFPHHSPGTARSAPHAPQLLCKQQKLASLPSCCVVVEACLDVALGVATASVGAGVVTADVAVEDVVSVELTPHHVFLHPSQATFDMPQ
jgi:hypothetical protein